MRCNPQSTFRGQSNSKRQFSLVGVIPNGLLRHSERSHPTTQIFDRSRFVHPPWFIPPVPITPISVPRLERPLIKSNKNSIIFLPTSGSHSPRLEVVYNASLWDRGGSGRNGIESLFSDTSTRGIVLTSCNAGSGGSDFGNLGTRIGIKPLFGKSARS